MPRKKKYFFSISLLIIILVGCNSQPQNPHSPTVSPSPKDFVFSPCLEIQPYLPKRTDISGQLLVKHSGIPYVFNLDSGQKTAINIPESVAGNQLFVSLNGKWISYSVYKANINNMLIVESVENILKNDYKNRITWGGNQKFNLEGWLDNESLIVTRRPDQDHFFSTLILNPFANEEHEFFLEDLPDYKNYLSGGVGLYHFPGSNLMPDPTLSLLVYPERRDGQDYVTLWDIEKKTSLVHLKDLYAYKSDPLWSQDGSNFLIAASTMHTDEKTIFDWFSVTKAGTVFQITDFGAFLIKNSISKAARSPNGRYLTFHMEYQDGSEEKAKYFLIDLKEKKLSGFCIDSFHIVAEREKQPVWSPDGKYVVFSNTDDKDNGSLILVNIEERRAYTIAKDLHARGWVTGK